MRWQKRGYDRRIIAKVAPEVCYVLLHLLIHTRSTLKGRTGPGTMPLACLIQRSQVSCSADFLLQTTAFQLWKYSSATHSIVSKLRLDSAQMARYQVGVVGLLKEFPWWTKAVDPPFQPLDYSFSVPGCSVESNTSL
jgi:hypothetical protein